jgi:hypothetical protein
VSHVIVKLLGKDSLLDGPRETAPQFRSLCVSTSVSGEQMLKSKQGEAAYWLVGTATVMLATWQFAVMVTN